jgi:hypothetical protein
MSGTSTETAESAETADRPLPVGDVPAEQYPDLADVHPGEEYREAARYAAEAGIPSLKVWYVIDGRLASPVAINEEGVVAVAYADTSEGLEYEPAWRFEEDNENVRRVPEGVAERPEEVIEDYLKQHIASDLGTLGGSHPVNGYGDAETVRDVELALALTTVVSDDPRE